MYAVIKTGGKQYKVSQGDTIRVEKLTAAEGDAISFEEVLLIADGGNIQVGTPLIEGTSVAANVVKHGRGKKIEIIKFKRRKHHRKQAGHRQDYTEVEITAIGGKAASKPKPAPKAKAAADTSTAAEADDLKQLSGVGPKLAEKLNEAGIFRFAQIAQMSAAEIAEIEEKLSLAGRFERDNWVEQAKELAAAE